MADDSTKKTVGVSKEEIEKGKTMAIVTYLGLIGFIVALATDGKKNEYTRFHMNQALPIMIAMLVSPIPVIGWIVAVAGLVFWIMGIINAANGEMKRLPVIGNFELIK